MVIKETQRTYTYLNLYGYATDAVLCKPRPADTITDPYFAQWKDLQKQNLAPDPGSVRRTAAADGPDVLTGTYTVWIR